jgi:excisionase family DNA binding protein
VVAEDERPAEALGFGEIARGTRELLELPIGDGNGGNMKRRHRDALSDSLDDTPVGPIDVAQERLSARMSVPEIAARLRIGRLAVYSMLEQGIIPGVRIGRRWPVTRHAYQQWERTCRKRDSKEV